MNTPNTCRDKEIEALHRAYRKIVRQLMQRLSDVQLDSFLEQLACRVAEDRRGRGVTGLPRRNTSRDAIERELAKATAAAANMPDS